MKEGFEGILLESKFRVLFSIGSNVKRIRESNRVMKVLEVRQNPYLKEPHWTTLVRVRRNEYEVTADLYTWPRKYGAKASFLPWAKALAIGTNSEVILEDGVRK